MATKAKTTNGASRAGESATGASAMKDGFERAVKGFDHLAGFSRETFDAWMRSADAAARGFEAINTETLSYTRRSLEDGLAAARGAMSARTVQEWVELQSGFTQSAFDSYLNQMTRISDMMAGTAREALDPLSRRFEAFVEQARAGQAS